MAGGPLVSATTYCVSEQPPSWPGSLVRNVERVQLLGAFGASPAGRWGGQQNPWELTVH